MPRMPKYLKREWAFFLDERCRKKYNELCRKCERSCKQSFSATCLSRAEFLLLAVKNEKSGRRKGGGAFERIVRGVDGETIIS